MKQLQHDGTKSENHITGSDVAQAKGDRFTKIVKIMGRDRRPQRD